MRPSIVFGVAASIFLAGSTMFGRQQDRELSGIRGLPVQGHDIVAGVEIVGTKQFREPGFQKMRDRFRSNGADLGRSPAADAHVHDHRGETIPSNGHSGAIVIAR